MYTADMFDFTGSNKLNAESVDIREDLIRHYAQDNKTLFFCSHSSGKDSQSMYQVIKRLVPKEQIVVVHANLGRVEHNGVVEHIESTVDGLPVHVVENARKDFIGMVLLRKMFPSAQFRQCTSDLKTNELDKFIRRTMKERGVKVGFNCIGLRAEESRARAMKNPLWINKRLTLKPNKKGHVARTVFDWMPVFHLTEEEVYDTIYEAGQKPHPAYGYRGSKNKRLSCVFCIMGCKNDLINGAKEYPELYHTMVALEQVVDHTMFTKKLKGETIKVTLVDKTGVPVDQNEVNRIAAELRTEQLALEAGVMAEKAAKASKPKKQANSKRAHDTSTIEMFE